MSESEKPSVEPELVFLKLGGSLITDKGKPYTARIDILQRLCEEIHRARKQKFSLLIGHGSGSFAHVSANRYQTAKGLVDEKSWEGFVTVHQDAAKLNRIVCDALLQAGELVVPVQPSSACIAYQGRIQTWYTKPIQGLLQAGIIPLVYGDVCLDSDRNRGMGIISTEEIFRYLCTALRPNRIVMAGKVDGVFDANGAVVSAIGRSNLDDIRNALLPSDGVADVTGGMLHKVERSLEMGVPTQVINGLKPGLLERALLGRRVEGTTIGP